jgi:tetratricopeptide (TPR) repeat protein
MTAKLQVGGLVLLAVLSSAASAQDGATPAAPRKPPPVFQASGLQGNTAPSGYAGGAAEAYSAKVATLAMALQTRDMSKMEHATGGLREAALTALKARNYGAASEAIERLSATNGGAVDAHKLQGALDAALGNPTDAIAAFDAAAKLDPSAENLNSACLARLAFGTSAEAQAAFASATAQHPESAELWLGLGLAAQLAGKPATAHEALLKAASGPATRRLAFTLLALETGTDASWNAQVRAALRPLVEARTDDAILDYDDALLLGKAGSSLTEDEALRQKRQELARAIEVQPGFAAAHFELGLLASESGDLAVAVDEFGKANALDDGIPEWHYRLSRVYRRLNRPSDAERELRRFQELNAQRVGQSEVTDALLQGLPLQELIP